MKKIEAEKQRLIEANKIIIKGRWFYVAVVFIMGMVCKLFGGLYVNFPISMIVAILLGSYGLNVLYLLYLKKAKDKSLLGLRIVSFMQLFADSLLVTIIIYFAGGISSLSFLYYLYSLIGSAFIYGFLGVALVVTMDSLAYASVILLEFYKVIPYLPRYHNDLELFLAFDKVAVFTNIFTIVSSFYIISYFSGLIAKSLHNKEHEAAKERDKVKAILSNLTDGLVYIDEKGKIDLVNTRAERMFNFKSKNVLQKRVKDIKKQGMSPLVNILQEKELVKEYDFLNTKDDYFKVYTFEVKNDDDINIGSAKIIHDISREKHVDRIKSEFITIASHQLRTPLSGVKGALSLLMSGDYGKVNREQKTIMAQSYDYIERLIKIVDDMLSVSSAEEGKFKYEYRKTEIKSFVAILEERFREDAKNKKIEINFYIDDDLPFVDLDREKFKLVLNSLIENAIIYNKNEGKVDVSFTKKQDKLLITVKDTGIGISKDVGDRIFTKFFRADNALKMYTEGNGLDLYVVKNIIDNHQGEIWFESKLDEGTTFLVEIPFVQNLVKKIEK